MLNLACSPDDRFEIIAKPQGDPNEPMEWRLKCLGETFLNFRYPSADIGLQTAQAKYTKRAQKRLSATFLLI